MKLPRRPTCSYFITHKRRYCKQQCREGSLFCGIHQPASSSSKRVVCPVDPSHTVLETELNKHIAVCPKVLQQKQRQARPHFRRDCNAGGSLVRRECTAGGGLVKRSLPNHVPHSSRGSRALSALEACGIPCLNGSAASNAAANAESETVVNRHASASRASYLQRLGPLGFEELLAKIELAHRQVCSSAGAQHEIIPAECQALLDGRARPLHGTDHVRPFALKHARQQAAILGQLQAHGLLQDTCGTSFLELGAGKAYLACMLAEAFPVQSLVLVDNQSFKLQADRTLRKLGVQLERIVLDIKDFEPAGLACLGSGLPWVGLGKHLCGAATDFALLCMARCAASPAEASSEAPQPQQDSEASADAQGQHSSTIHQACTEQQESLNLAGLRGSSESLSQNQSPQHGLCHPAVDLEPNQAVALGKVGSARSGLQGFGIATCCHHRCSWEHYVGRSFFQEHSMAEADFQLVSWMTGWAVCGHGRPPMAAAFGSCEKEGSSNSDAACSAEGGACLEGVGAADGCMEAEEAHGAHALADVPFHPSRSMPLDRRRRLGAMCKQLIDAGRLQFLARHGFPAARAVSYVDQDVTGENRMLIGVAHAEMK